MLVITLRTDDGVDAVLETSDGPILIQLSELRPHNNAARVAFELPDSVEVKRVVRASGEVVGARGDRSLAKITHPKSSSPLSAGVAEATLAVTGQDAPATAGDDTCDRCAGTGVIRIEPDGSDRGGAVPCNCRNKPLVIRGQGEYARPTYGRDILQQTAVGGLINAIV